MVPRDLPPEYQFRQCDRDDVEALGRLYFDSYEPGVAAATQEEAVADMHATFNGEYGNLWPAASEVVENKGQLVAAIQVVERAPWEDTPDCPFIIELFTSRAHRRQGLAHALVERCMQLASRAGHDQVALRVDDQNEPALALYHQLGFKRLT